MYLKFAKFFNCYLLSCLFVLLFSGLSFAQEITGQSYQATLKISPRVEDFKIFQAKINKNEWSKYLDSWDIGLFKRYSYSSPPFVISESNSIFLTEEEKNTKEKISNKNRSVIFNCYESILKTDIVFEINPMVQAEDVECFLNNKLVENVLLNENNRLRLENIHLNPGVNFFDVKLKKPQKKILFFTVNKIKDISLVLKNSFDFSNYKVLPEIIKNEYWQEAVAEHFTINDQDNGILMHYTGKTNEFVLMHRKINEIIDDYPYLSFYWDFLTDTKAHVFCFIGLDINQDGRTDKYYQLQRSDEFNLFEACDGNLESQVQGNSFQITDMVVVAFNLEDKEYQEEDYTNDVLMRWGDLKLYSRKAITLDKQQIDLKKLTKSKLINTESFDKGFDRKDKTRQFGVFFENFNSLIKQEAYWDIKLDSIDSNRFPYLKIDFKLQNEVIQNIKVLFKVKDDNNTYEYAESGYEKDNLIVNLKKILPANALIEEMALVFSKNKKVWGKSAKNNVYTYTIKKIEFSNQINFSARTKQAQNNFNNFLKQLNPLIAVIGDKKLFLNDFDFANNDFFNVGRRKINLSSGVKNVALIDNSSIDIAWLMLEPINRVQERIAAESMPEINFERISNTGINVSVVKAELPFWLVFGESFHPQWKAYVIDKLGSKIPLEEHYLVNAYCNGWFVRPDKLKKLGLETDELKIVLDFFPQHIAFWSMLISLSVIFTCLIYISRKKKVKPKRKKNK